jgi:hypothetical protein
LTSSSSSSSASKPENREPLVLGAGEHHDDGSDAGLRELDLGVDFGVALGVGAEGRRDDVPHLEAFLVGFGKAADETAEVRLVVGAAQPGGTMSSSEKDQTLDVNAEAAVGVELALNGFDHPGQLVAGDGADGVLLLEEGSIDAIHHVEPQNRLVGTRALGRAL